MACFPWILDIGKCFVIYYEIKDIVTNTFIYISQSSNQNEKIQKMIHDSSEAEIDNWQKIQ